MNTPQPPHQVTVSRGRDGKGNISAETEFDLGFDRRVLTITTTRCGNALQSKAQVSQMWENGLGRSTAFGIAGKGDFSAVLATTRSARATEKAITALHSTALLEVEQTLARARSYYERKAS